MTIGQLVQRVARTESAQAVLRRPRAARLSEVLIQSTTVRSPLRYAYRELFGDGRLERYLLRHSGRPVFIRHHTADPLVLTEIFYTGHYDLPEEVAALLDGLRRPPRVLDLGANVGLFGVWALTRFPGCEITAFEPDPTNAAVARICIEANAAEDRWHLVEAAATDADGRVPFIPGEFSRSRIQADGGNEVDAVDVFPYFAEADLAKVDIEGGEWALLGDSRFRELPSSALALEYHPDQAPGPDPRALALDVVGAAGYETRVVEEFAAGHGMLWAWRTER